MLPTKNAEPNNQVKCLDKKETKGYVGIPATGATGGATGGVTGGATGGVTSGGNWGRTSFLSI